MHIYLTIILTNNTKKLNRYNLLHVINWYFGSHSTSSRLA